MSDNMTAKIKIGGPLKASILSQFIDAVVGQGVNIGDGWGESGGVDAADVHAEITEAIAKGEYLRFYDIEARYGMFPDLEEWCRKHGLTYWRHNSAKYEYTCMIEWWTPGMDKPGECFSTEDELVLLDAQDITCATRNAYRNNRDPARAVEAYIELHTPAIVPPLTIVDDTGPKVK